MKLSTRNSVERGKSVNIAEPGIRRELHRQIDFFAVTVSEANLSTNNRPREVCQFAALTSRIARKVLIHSEFPYTIFDTDQRAPSSRHEAFDGVQRGHHVRQSIREQGRRDRNRHPSARKGRFLACVRIRHQMRATAIPPTPTHLAASMRVVASHLHMRRVTIDTARDAVLDAARTVKAGTATPEIVTLVDRLEKVTGVDIAELGNDAEDWREV